jgi:hypothetical protein
MLEDNYSGHSLRMNLKEDELHSMNLVIIFLIWKFPFIFVHFVMGLGIC